MPEVMYQYAASETSGLIHISALSQETRKNYGVLTCQGCDREMVASLGTQVRHHFKHKHTTDESGCSFESYLHKMGKTLLADALRQDHAQSRSLYVLTRGDALNVYDVSGEHHITIEDLISTDVYSGVANIEIEKGVNGFVADVLVSYCAASPILFEIAVSHRCDPEKIRRGGRIVEFVVKSEQDIENMLSIIRSGHIFAADNIILHGFPKGTEHTAYDAASVQAVVKALREECDDLRRKREEMNLDLTFAKSKITRLEVTNEALTESLAQKTAPGDTSAPAPTPGGSRATAFISPNGAIFVGNGHSRPAGVWETFTYPEPQNAGTNHKYDAAVREAQRRWPGRVRSCLLCTSHAFSSGAKPMFCFRNNALMYQGQASKCAHYEVMNAEALRKKRAYLLSKARTQKERSAIPA